MDKPVNDKATAPKLSVDSTKYGQACPVGKLGGLALKEDKPMGAGQMRGGKNPKGRKFGGVW